MRNRRTNEEIVRRLKVIRTRAPANAVMKVLMLMLNNVVQRWDLASKGFDRFVGN
jgi:hypothetical protein